MKDKKTNLNDGLLTPPPNCSHTQQGDDSPQSPAKASIAYNVFICLPNEEYVSLRLYSHSQNNIGTKTTKHTPNKINIRVVSHRPNGKADEGVHHHEADSLYYSDGIEEIDKDQQQQILDLIKTYFNTLSRVYTYKDFKHSSDQGHNDAYEVDISKYERLRGLIKTRHIDGENTTEQEQQFWEDIFTALDDLFEFSDTRSFNSSLLNSAYKRFINSNIKFGHAIDQNLTTPLRLLTEPETTSTSSGGTSFLPRACVQNGMQERNGDPKQEEEEGKEENQPLISPDTVTTNNFEFNDDQTKPTESTESTESTANNNKLFQVKRKKEKRTRSLSDVDQNENESEDEDGQNQDKRQRTEKKEENTKKPFDLYGGLLDAEPSQQRWSHPPGQN